MGIFVRAVITGFGFTLGKTLFDQLKNRYLPEKNEPQEVIVVDPSDLDSSTSSRDR